MLSKQNNDQNMPQMGSMKKEKGSGSEYHIKHADHLEGYGEPYNNAEGPSSTTTKSHSQ
ncbi:hypothetical protein [uncultured Metabacillus sp.]|uniref:hypothetical protein n=1 Tax=uncultured Metabacillus sp. TaxID=2860135 RepID=UPI002637C1F1|nr:hypothetical protein [uncultured Metabacillus sp.]